MNSKDKLYRDLQMHLDRQTIGFPETPSGSDIALLKQLFTPAQAEVTRFFTCKFEPFEQIQERAAKEGISAEKTERILDETARRAVIGFRKKEGSKQILHYTLSGWDA
jgi:Na+-translocating ferredoxin:NAD+ oxidoreductase subunit B